jgi:DNA polymerase III subunit alpha
MMAFFKQAKIHHLKPILGLKINISFEMNETGFLVYVKNQEGYPNLLKLLLLKGERALTLEDVVTYQEGLIFVTSGMDSIIDSLILEDQIERAHAYLKIFKKEIKNLFLGMSLQSFDHEFKVAPKLFLLSEETNIKLLPIHRTCYLEKNDEEVYEALIKIDHENNQIPKDTHYQFMNKNQLISMFQDYPFVFDTLEKLIKDISFQLDMPAFQMPIYKVPKGTPETYLKSLSILGLKKRLSSKDQYDEKIYQERLIYELKVIHQMGYDSYFLIVYDFVKYAKTNGILVGPGRGSAAGSLVAYCLGITDVDPITYGLLFERFLNPERITMPDIDLDFPDDRRDEVLQYVKNKYGEFHTLSIVTFGTFALKSSIRDIARVMKIETSRVTGIIESIIRNNIDQTDLEITRLVSVAKKIEGLPRHTGTHAAGIILANQDLSAYIPLQIGPSHFYQSQLEQSDLEALGLLKIDFLGIKNLSIIDETLKSINRLTKRLSIHEMPLDDLNTFRLLSNGDTSGIFQLESMGMRQVLRKLKPNSFEDIVAINALYRPGPMGHIDLYIERRNGKEYTFIHPDLKPILESTYGIIVYQEQIMRIASEFAGLSLAEADLLRRAISKKDKETLDFERERFVSNCTQKQYPKEVSEKIYDLIVRFADYGFNRSHSVAYGLIAYQMAYLKANYFSDFISVLLSSVIGNESQTKEYITEAKQRNIHIYPPNINISTDIYIIKDEGIYMPIQAIKGIGKTLCQKILTEREQGVFIDYQSLKIRLKGIINDKNLEMLIHSGALDDLSINHQTMIKYIDMKDAGYEQYITDYIISKFDEFQIGELTKFEKEALGFNLKYHPLIMYEDVKKNLKLDVLSDLEHQQEIEALAFVEKFKVIQTKAGKQMAFLVIDDGNTQIEVTCFTKEYEQYQHLFNEGVSIFKIGQNTFLDQTSYVLSKIKKF